MRSLRFVTYNVHRCIGSDRRVSVARVGEVLAQVDADVIALQEVDVACPEGSGIDQPAALAEALGMRSVFCPTLRRPAHEYGHAVLSRLPMRAVRHGLLPACSRETAASEARAAMWGTVDVSTTELHVFSTHLGLGRAERTLQASALLGHHWLGHPALSGPRLLCGDLNALPGSVPYQMLSARMRDVQCCIAGRRARPTWPSPLPLLRIDHVFASSEVSVRDVHVFWNSLTRRASDHLPLVVDFEFS